MLTGSDGRFTLRRIYPGTSTLRVYRQNGERLDSVDAKQFTVSWEATTNTPQVLGDLVLIGLPAYNSISVSVGGFTSPNTLGPDACKPSSSVGNELYGGNVDAPLFFPLAWNGNRFGTSGSSAVNGVAASTYPSRTTSSMSVSGTLDAMHADSIWLTVTGTETLRIEELVPGPSGAAWQLTVQETATFTLGRLGLVSNGATPAVYRAALHGAAAAAILTDGTMSYFNQSTVIPTFHPYSCNAYTLNPLNADVQVTLRIRGP